MITKLNREEILSFLDELSQYPHNESDSKILRCNFGMSRELAHGYIKEWKESRSVNNTPTEEDGHKLTPENREKFKYLMNKQKWHWKTALAFLLEMQERTGKNENE